MSKSKLKIFLILFAIIVLISTGVYATEATPETPATGETENKPISEEDVIQIDKFYAGDDIVIENPINGNVFVVGKNVTLKGPIAGNFIVIAEKLTMEAGTVLYGSLYTIASEADISAQMYDLYAVCDKITIGYYGTTQRSVNIMATDVTIDGVVYRDAYIEADKLVLDSKCEISGDLVYTAKSEAVYLEEVTTEEAASGEESENNVQTKETTEIPASVVAGEKKFTQRNKKLFNKQDEVKNRVDNFIKNNKINNDTTEEQLKSLFVVNMVNMLGIKTNSNVTDGENAKNVAKTMQIPAVVVYVDIAVIVLLIIALVSVLIIKKDKTPKENKQ